MRQNLRNYPSSLQTVQFVLQRYRFKPGKKNVGGNPAAKKKYQMLRDFRSAYTRVCRLKQNISPLANQHRTDDMTKMWWGLPYFFESLSFVIRLVWRALQAPEKFRTVAIFTLQHALRLRGASAFEEAFIFPFSNISTSGKHVFVSGNVEHCT